MDKFNFEKWDKAKETKDEYAIRWGIAKRKYDALVKLVSENSTSVVPKISLTGSTCVWGRSEMGKSTIAQKAIKAACKLDGNKKRQLVIIDPLARDGTDAMGVKRALETGNTPVICNSPIKDEQIGAILFALSHSTPDEPVYVVADEAPSYMKNPRDILSRAVLQGRHAGFGIMIIGQRAADVYAQYRTQAKQTIWLGLVDHADLETARKVMGERASVLPHLKQGQYVKWPS